MHTPTLSMAQEQGMGLVTASLTDAPLYLDFSKLSSEPEELKIRLLEAAFLITGIPATSTGSSSRNALIIAHTSLEGNRKSLRFDFVVEGAYHTSRKHVEGCDIRTLAQNTINILTHHLNVSLAQKQLLGAQPLFEARAASAAH